MKKKYYIHQILSQGFNISLIYFLGILVGYLNITLTFPYVFTKEQIGIYTLIYHSALLLVPITNLNLNNTLIKFFPYINESKSIKASFLGFIILLSLTCFSVFLTILYGFSPLIRSFFSSKIQLFAPHVTTILILTFLLVLGHVLECWCRSLLHILVPLFLRAVLVKVCITFSLIFYFYGWINFTQWLNILLYIYLIEVFSLLVFLFFLDELHINFHIKSLSFYIPMRNFFFYTLYTFANELNNRLLHKTSTIMISYMLGLTNAAVYFITSAISIIIEIPRRAANKFVQPMLANILKNQSNHELSLIYDYLIWYLFLPSCWIFILLISNLNQIFYIIPRGDTYLSGKYVLVIISFSKLLENLFSIHAETLHLSNHYRFNLLIVTLSGFFSLFLHYFLIRLLSINGAALATLLSLLQLNLVKAVFINRKYKISILSKSILKIIFISILSYITIDQVPHLSMPLLDIIFRSILVSIIYFALLFGFQILPKKDS